MLTNAPVRNIGHIVYNTVVYLYLNMSGVKNKKQDNSDAKIVEKSKESKEPLLEGLFLRVGRRRDDKKKKDVLGDMKKKVTGRKNLPRFMNILMWVAIIYLAISFGLDGFDSREITDPTISDVAASIQAGEVEEIVVRGQKVRITYIDEKVGELRKDNIASFDETLLNLGVTAEQLADVGYSVKKETGLGYWMKTLLPFLFPLLILGLFIWYLSRQTKGMGGYAGVSVRSVAGALC